MAIALASRNFRVALIDPAPHGGGGGDGRTTALAYASVRLFRRLSLWDELAPGASPIHDILVTDGRPRDRFRRGDVSDDGLHFPSQLLPDDRTRPGGEPLGHIVENRAMNDLLEARAAASDQIERFYGTGVVTADRDLGGVTLTLSDGARLRASLLIACDGKNSALRDRFGFKTLTWGYWQDAIICNIAHSEPHRGVAHEVFYPSGPFAILPMTENRSSIVWTEKRSRARAFFEMSDTGFLAALHDRIGDMLGELTLASDRARYPLTFGLARSPVQARVALAGDAAHWIHPIAGQGFNLGIKDIAALADVLEEAGQAGLDIGDGAVLDRYAQWRRFDVVTLALGTDGMNRFFSNNNGALRALRRTGLRITNAIDPARVFFMRHAGADVGTLPTLMQPL